MEVNTLRNVFVSTKNSAVQLLKNQTNNGLNNGSRIPYSSTDDCVKTCLESSGGKILLQTQGLSKMVTGSSQTTFEDCSQVNMKNNNEKTDDVSFQLGVKRNSCGYSTSAILVPLISTTSARNILEEMKRKVAHTLLNQQKAASSQELKPSLVPGTNVEYRTPGANHKNKNGRIKRPMNAFMVWARDYRSHLAISMPNATNSEISVRLGQIWAVMEVDDKKKYYGIAENIKAKHRKDYPDWVYQPSAPGLKKKEEALNYGRTPTPPPNNQQIYGVPFTTHNTSSSASDTQQTTIVVLSNDNKINHTKLTTSQSLLLHERKTTSPSLANRSFTKSSGKVVPTTIASNNDSNSHLHIEKSAIQTSGDLSQIQYQSALEIPEINKVTDKTKDLLAMKIISARPFDAVSSRITQATRNLKEECVKSATRLSYLEKQIKTPETIHAYQQYPNIQLTNKPEHVQEIVKPITNAGSNTVTMMARQNNNPTYKTTESSVNEYAQFTSVLSMNNKTGFNQAVKHTLSDTPKHVTVQVATAEIDRTLMLNPLSQTAFDFEVNLSTPNVSPLLANGMIKVATINSVRDDLQKMRPKAQNISKHFNIPVAESVISPTSSSIRHIATLQDSQFNTKPPSVSKITEYEYINNVQEQDKSTFLPKTNIRDSINPALDVVQHKEDVTDDITSNIPIYFPKNSCVDEMTPWIKQEDELWPFPFSDNPGDWINDGDKGMYVEMIDPYDPFLGPDEMLSETCPGSLKLDMERWNDYMATKPNMGTEQIETLCCDTTDDITISPVPLRETLRRLVNADTQVSDMCDVISGDLIAQEDDENIGLDQYHTPALLSNDLAQELSAIMEFIMTGNEKLNEVDTKDRELDVDDVKTAHVNTDSIFIVEKCHKECELVRTGKNDETSKWLHNCVLKDSNENDDEARKKIPDTENKDKICFLNQSKSDRNIIISTSNLKSTADETFQSTTEVVDDIKKNNIHKQNKETVAHVNVKPRRSTRSHTKAK